MKYVRFLSTMALGIFLVACGSPISEKNFERIENDMPEMEVLNILGDPKETSNITLGPVSTTTSVWENEHAKITIQFVNGSVQIKTFKNIKNN